MNNNSNRFIQISVISLFSFFVIYTFAKQEYLPLLLSFGLIAASFLNFEFSCLLFGLLLPLASMFGSLGYDMLCISWAMSLIFFFKNRENYFNQKMSFGLILFCSAFIFSFLYFLASKCDLIIAESIYQARGIKVLLNYIIQIKSSWLPTLSFVSSIIAASVFSYIIFSMGLLNREIKKISTGLIIGYAFSILILFFQLYKIKLGEYNFVEKINPYWIILGRYQSSFTDPNAFGIFSVILAMITLLLGIQLFSKALLFLFFTIPAFFSGSRTFVLGLFLACLYVVYFKSKKIFFGMIVFLILIVSALGEPFINNKIQHILPTVSLKRTVQSINWNDSREMFYSRSIYTKIATHVWLLDPAIGVGLGRFFSEQTTAAEKLDINLNGWKDNANNFYLGILAEQGIFGFILVIASFCLLFSSMRFNKNLHIENYQEVCKVVVCIFLMLLITGPHINFPDIRYLFAFILAISIPKMNIKLNFNKSLVLCSLGILFFIFYFVFSTKYSINKGHRGLYTKEYAEDIGDYYWTSKKAFIKMTEGDSDIFIRAILPNDKFNNIKVKILNRDDNSLIKEIDLSNSNWIRVDNLPKFPLIEVSQTWNPSIISRVSDYRELGVMLRF